MKNLKLVFLLALTLTVVNAAFAQSRVGGKVIEIVDGKTIIIETFSGSKITAELQYIEVPEFGQPLYETTKDHLQNLVFDKKVEFRARGLTQNKTVGQLFLKGVDISQQMIRDGAAWYAVLEKNGQDAAESEIYQNNEVLAKNEKRGIWAIENLKPAWQIRAEAEQNRRVQEKFAQDEAAKVTYAEQQTPQHRKPAVKRQMNSESQLLSASAGQSVKLPANMKIVGGLLVGYNPSTKLGAVATPMMKMDVADTNGKQVVGVQLVYLYYDGNENKGRQNVYLVGIISQSQDFKFLKYNDLVVTADNRKIVIGKATRIARRNEIGVVEGLEYQIKKSAFTEIANAKKLKIKVGTYSGELGDIQMLLHNLLQASL